MVGAPLARRAGLWGPAYEELRHGVPDIRAGESVAEEAKRVQALYPAGRYQSGVVGLALTAPGTHELVTTQAPATG